MQFLKISSMGLRFVCSWEIFVVLDTSVVDSLVWVDNIEIIHLLWVWWRSKLPTLCPSHGFNEVLARHKRWRFKSENCVFQAFSKSHDITTNTKIYWLSENL